MQDLKQLTDEQLSDLLTEAMDPEGKPLHLLLCYGKADEETGMLPRIGRVIDEYKRRHTREKVRRK